MLNRTRQNIENIRKKLLRQQKDVEEDLKSLKDPVMADGLAESTEPGTESWLADVHNQAVAVKDNLQKMLEGIRQSLVNLKTGNYGKCQRCGKDIEAERLEAMPTAKYCLSCSKKISKR